MIVMRLLARRTTLRVSSALFTPSPSIAPDAGQWIIVDGAIGGMTKITDTLTFVDESGLNGFVRRLRPSDDDDIALLCGLPVPIFAVDFLRTEVLPFYEAFCDAAPPDATLHVTDAFASGNAPWCATAEAARAGIFEIVRRHRMYVVYAARRGAIARARHESEAAERAAAAAELNKTSRRVSALTSPSKEKILDEVMTTFACRVNSFMKKHRRQRTDFCFDVMSPALVRGHTERLTDLRNLLESRHTVTIWDTNTRKSELKALDIKFETECDIDMSFLGVVRVLEKSEPLIFAIDIIANSLYRHLKRMPSRALLNVISSVEGWDLAENTFLTSAVPPVLDLA